MKYVVQRYRVRPEDGAKFVLLRSETDDPLKAQTRMAALAAADPRSEHEIVSEPDAEIPPYVPPSAPTPADPQVTTDGTIVAAFMKTPSGAATAAQRDEIIKAIVRYLRRMGQAT